MRIALLAMEITHHCHVDAWVQAVMHCYQLASRYCCRPYPTPRVAVSPPKPMGQPLWVTTQVTHRVVFAPVELRLLGKEGIGRLTSKSFAPAPKRLIRRIQKADRAVRLSTDEIHSLFQNLLVYLAVKVRGPLAPTESAPKHPWIFVRSIRSWFSAIIPAPNQRTRLLFEYRKWWSVEVQWWWGPEGTWLTMLRKPRGFSLLNTTLIRIPLPQHPTPWAVNDDKASSSKKLALHLNQPTNQTLNC